MHNLGKCDICNSYGNTDGQVKDIEESGPKSKGEGSTPSRTKSRPKAAICAPLSVQKRSGGIRTLTPTLAARSN